MYISMNDQLLVGGELIVCVVVSRETRTEGRFGGAMTIPISTERLEWPRHIGRV